MLKGMMDNYAAGQFSAAARIADLGVFIPTIIAQSTTPLLVKARQQSPRLYALQRQKFMDLMVWGALVIALIISLSAAFVVPVLYGTEYLGSVAVLQIIGWKAFVISLASSSGQIILVDHLQRYAILRNLLGCASVILLNLVLIPRWGTVGAAVSGLCSMLISGYFAHCLIKPYRYILPLQNHAIFMGWKRLFSMGLILVGRLKK
jgi:O-antigen/teichoic acid export membrane protein